MRFLRRSWETLLLIAIVVATAVIFETLIAVWLSRSYNLTVLSVGTIYMTGIEAYGGDINSTRAYLDLDPEEVVKSVGKPCGIIYCFTILNDDQIMKYFELG